MRTRAVILELAVALTALCAPGLSAAQWLPDGNPIATSARHQWRSQLLADGAGGVFLTWEDARSSLSLNDIYATRLTASGGTAAGWTAGGTLLCDAPGFQSEPQVADDGLGGSFVAWLDGRAETAYSVFAQRVDRAGRPAPGWPAGGLPLVPRFAGFPRLVADGTGGALAVWDDDRKSDSDHDIYAQHVSASGARVAGWPADGLGVSTSTRDDLQPAALADGAGGVFVAWETNVGSDLYAQRVTGAGAIAPGWPRDGLLLSGAPGNQRDIVLAPDGAGGVLAAWYDARDDNGDIYAQRFTGDGRIAEGWPADGLAVCTAAGSESYPALVPTPDGAIVVWTDERSGVSLDLYAQRITRAGGIATGWPANGVPVCTAPGHQLGVKAVPDGAGGIVAAWEDRRSDAGDIYALRLTAGGLPADGWPVDGIALCSAPRRQSDVAVATDAAGGAFVSWTDERSGDLSTSDVYAARVTGGGATGPSVPAERWPAHLTVSAPRPNPARGPVTVRFTLPGAARISARVVDPAGRIVRRLTDRAPFEAGRQLLAWDGRGEGGARIPAGLYLLELSDGSQAATARIVQLP